jgi:hypothetical protein
VRQSLSLSRRPSNWTTWTTGAICLFSLSFYSSSALHKPVVAGQITRVWRNRRSTTHHGGASLWAWNTGTGQNKSNQRKESANEPTETGPLGNRSEGAPVEVSKTSDYWTCGAQASGYQMFEDRKDNSQNFEDFIAADDTNLMATPL